MRCPQALLIKNIPVRRVLSILLKVLLGLVLAGVLLVVGALIAIRVPKVQTYVARQATELLSRRLGQQVSIGQVDVRPFSRVLLNDVRVLDRQGDELLSVGRADARVSVFSIFSPDELRLSRLTLEEPRFVLRHRAGQPDSTTFDQFLAAVKRLVGPPQDTASAGFDFGIEAVTLRNGHFAIEKEGDPREPYYGQSIDYDHLVVDSIYADISRIQLGDTLALRIQDLHAVETPSQTRLREITADMTYYDDFWEFKELSLRVGRSQIKDFLRFEFRAFSNFTEFNDSVKTIAHLRGSQVFTDDIAKFAPALADIHDSVRISARASGYVRDFKLNDLDLRYGRGTHIVAKNAHADNLPNYRESFVDLRLLPSVVDPRDLRRWLPASANEVVRRLGTVKLKGTILGFYSDFVANATFDTALGTVATDINLKVKTDLPHAAYSGTVRTDNFQLGRLLGDESVIRDVTLRGAVAGTGFLPPYARGYANVTAARIWLNGYRYHNVSLNGNFAYQHFNGRVRANDPAVKLVADGSFDLGHDQYFKVRAAIDYANLKALGLLDQALTVHTTADVEVRGGQLDSLTGHAYLRDSRFTLDGRSVSLDTLDVVSTRNRAHERRLTVRSEALDAQVSGTFKTSDVVRDVATLMEEYRLNFESNEAATAKYYREKRQRELPVYEIDLALRLKQANPLLQLFVPELSVADNSRIDGSFRSGETSIFQVGGHLDSLRYGPVRTYDTDFDFLTSKLPYKPDVLAQASVVSARQVLPGLGRTERFVVEGIWDQQRINFSTSLEQTGTTNRATINGALEFLPRTVEVVFRKSGLHLLDKDWTIAADNSVRISDYGREFDVQNLTLSNGQQVIGAQGFISGDASKPPLALTVKDFELATLNSLTGQQLGGRVNARGTVSGLYGPLTINSTLGVDSLTYAGTLIGQVAGSTDWDNASGKLRLNLDVAHDNTPVLAVRGDLEPGAAQDQLNLSATLSDTPIILAQPFLGSLFSNIGGTGRGQLRLTGKFAAPNLVGSIAVRNGRLKFDYLGTTYTFADRIDFTLSSISFRNVKLRDALGNTGIVDGEIRHQSFQNMDLDISADFRKLQVLSTNRQDNELYFGTAYATGTARVTGPTDDLDVRVRATSEAGTRISLPLDNAARAQKAGYIKFVNNNVADTVILRQAGPPPPKTDLSGLRLDMNLTITPDAYMEILLDENTGDIIRGTAAGQLRLNIDTRGDFNMHGQVEIVRGAYNFTLQGLVNKEFLVRPGGLISWNGDPLAGEMDVTATYTQRTSLAPIIDGLGTGNGGSSGVAVVPVTAVMNLTGPLLLPVIKLGLEFNDAPGALQGQLSAFMTSLRNDEQELNRQVFSLLVFKQLSPRGAFNQLSLRGEDNTVGNSLGQILSTQLGLLTSQIDQNLEIDFNINGLSAEQLQQLQVRLSYSFLNGRLRITREGGFTNNSLITNTPGSNGAVLPNNSNAAIFGDLSLEYFLRPDGKFRAKLRYETTPRDLEAINQTRVGLSLLHTEQFDTFGELFRREKPKSRERNTLRAREAHRDDRQHLEVNEDAKTVL